MRTKDFSIVILIIGLAAFGYAKYREKHAPKSAKEACDRGDTPSCRVHAGLAKQAGNIDEAKKYYRMACDKNDNHACHFLAALVRQEDAASIGETTTASASSPAPQTMPTAGCSGASATGCSAGSSGQ